jgi:methyl-accepting chemotaxis protein
MKWFYDMKIGKKLILSFCITAAIAGLVGYIGMSKLKQADDSNTELYEKMTVPIEILQSLSVDIQKIRVSARDALLAKSKDEREKHLDAMRQLRTDVTKRADEFEKTILSKETRDTFDEYKRADVEYVPSLERFITMMQDGKNAEALDLLHGDLGQKSKSMQDVAQKMVDMKLAHAEAKSEANTVAGNAASTNMLVVVIVGVFAAIGFGLLLSSIIGNPLRKLTEASNRLAAGDSTVQVDIDTKDELGILAKSFRAMIDNVREQAAAADKIAKGDLSVEIKPKSEQDLIGKGLQTVVANLKALIADVDMLVNAAVAGDLATRADASKHQGDYHKIVQGVNQTLDAIINPVNEAAAVLEKVAARDLGARVAGDYHGDHAKIKNTLNTAVNNLDEALSQVAIAAEQVTSAAGQISSGSQALAQGSSEQASSLEEISSSLQEMSSMTKQNAANAKEARNLSDGARASSGRGVDSMHRLSEAINKIKASSDATAKIVKTIDEIAFQTNLLALNAAVEAARAGDAGKGFAVVAEEVRNLAMRSAEAAKNTANLIEESVHNAEGGVSINQEVLKNLEEINEQVKKVGEVMAEIAAASDQQSQGVDQVNVAVEQMNQVTQQTAANSEESASAAEELSGQAEEMQSMVGSFRLSNSGNSTSKRRAEPVAARAAVKTAPPAAIAHKVPAVHKTAGNGFNAKNLKPLIPFQNDAMNDVLSEF